MLVQEIIGEPGAVGRRHLESDPYGKEEYMERVLEQVINDAEDVEAEAFLARELGRNRVRRKYSDAVLFRQRVKRKWNRDPIVYAYKRGAVRTGSILGPNAIGSWRFPDGSVVLIHDDGSHVLGAYAKRRPKLENLKPFDHEAVLGPYEKNRSGTLKRRTAGTAPE